MYELKQVRSYLHGIDQLINDLPKSRYTSLAFTACELSMMHSGNILKYGTDSNPYKNSTDFSNNIIDDYHVDEEVAPLSVPREYLKEFTVVQKIKWLRSELDMVLESWVATARVKAIDCIKATDITIALFDALTVSIIETRNWLGMELGSIRDKSNHAD